VGNQRLPEIGKGGGLYPVWKGQHQGGHQGAFERKARVELVGPKEKSDKGRPSEGVITHKERMTRLLCSSAMSNRVARRRRSQRGKTLRKVNLRVLGNTKEKELDSSGAKRDVFLQASKTVDDGVTPTANVGEAEIEGGNVLL